MISDLIFNLLVAHIVGDFYLQWNSFCRNKIRYSVRGYAIWVHVIFIGVLTWFAVCDVRAWWLVAAIVVSHFFIDWAKAALQMKLGIYRICDGRLVSGVNGRGDLWLFIVDQCLHITIFVSLGYLWLSYNPNWSQFGWLKDLMSAHWLRINTLLAISLALKPANVLVLLILGACKVNTSPDSDSETGSFHAGELIGWLERGLILLFVIMAQYEAIGFLIAAKSILRFSEVASGREKSEYVLAGTLLSLAISLCLGLAALDFRIS